MASRKVSAWGLGLSNEHGVLVQLVDLQCSHVFRLVGGHSSHASALLLSMAKEREDSAGYSSNAIVGLFEHAKYRFWNDGSARAHTITAKGEPAEAVRVWNAPLAPHFFLTRQLSHTKLKKKKLFAWCHKDSGLRLNM